MQYQGSCHCGQIAFTVQAQAPISEVVDCNCSLCRRRGGLLWFAPRADVALQDAAAPMSTYRFNKRHIAHHFCPVCGVAPYSEAVDPRSGVPTVAINVRCLQDVDLAALSVVAYDGAAS